MVQMMKQLAMDIYGNVVEFDVPAYVEDLEREAQERDDHADEFELYDFLDC